MSDAYIKRLEDAVRNAHKAMSVLKTEIAQLRAENTTLKSKLDIEMLCRECEEPNSNGAEVSAQKLSDDDSVVFREENAFVSNKTFSYMQTGWTNIAEFAQFKFNKDDPVKKWGVNVKQLLKLIATDNVHRCAHELSHYPARMNSRTIVDTIASLTNNESTEVFASVDLLATLCASIATIAPEGLFKFKEMWIFLVNSLFADIRTVNHSPLYALQTGDYSLCTIPTAPVVDQSSKKDTTVAVESTVATTASSVKNTGIEEVAKLFDFSESEEESSDDDDSVKDGHKQENAVNLHDDEDNGQNDGFRDAGVHDDTEVDAAVDLDNRGEEDDEDDDEDWMMNIDKEVTVAVPEAQENSGGDVSVPKSANRKDLEWMSLHISAKLYLLVRMCVKLGMKGAAVDLFRDIALITSTEGTIHQDGVIAGVVELLKNNHNKQFLGSSLRLVEGLCVVCTNCINWAKTQSKQQHQALMNQQDVERLALLVPEGCVTVVNGMTAAALTSADNAVSLETVCAFRRQGVWRTIIELSSLKYDKKEGRENVFELMGFQRLETQAQHFQTLLSLTSSFATLSQSCGGINNNGGEEAVTLMELIHSPCFNLVKDGLTTSVVTAEEEIRAVNMFHSHWCNRNSSIIISSSSGSDDDYWCHCLHSFRLLESLFASITSSEYDAHCFGWKMGVTGFGMSTKERLLNRLEIGMSMLKKVPEINRFFHTNSSSSSGDANGSDAALLRINWLKYCSVSDSELMRGTEYVDRIVKYFRSSGEAGAVPSSVHVTSIVTICNEITSLIAITAVERLMYLSACSARALLRVIREKTEETTAAVVDLSKQCARFLLNLPSPYGGILRSDIVFELLATEHKLMAKNSVQLVPPSVNQRISRLLPAFVINLDRRPDRWNKIIQLGGACQLLPLRIPAVDGNNIQSRHGSTLTMSTKAAAAAHHDKRQSIPESDVTFTWDSTENSYFDPGCAVNEQTVLSESERACAASHLAIWRTIVAITTHTTPSVVPGGAVATNSSNSNTSFGSSSSGTLAAAGVKVVDAALMQQCRFYFSSRMLHRPTLNPGIITHHGLARKSKAKARPAAVSPEDFFLILEDDAHVTPLHQTNFQHHLMEILRKLPVDAEILYLGGAVPKGGTKFKSSMTSNGLFCRVNYIWQLHAYLVKRSAVDTLLSHLPINGPVDNFVASLILHGDLTAYMLKKNLVIQSGNSLKNRRFDSNIRHSGRVKSHEKHLHLDSHDKKRTRLI